jgi:alpha-tubulin suppressor-like RCC1 family protein
VIDSNCERYTGLKGLKGLKKLKRFKEFKEVQRVMFKMNKIKNQPFAVEKLGTIPLKTLGVILVGLAFVGCTGTLASLKDSSVDTKPTDKGKEEQKKEIVQSTAHLGQNSGQRMKQRGEYTVYIFKDNSWQEVGAYQFTRFFREQNIDLSQFLPDEEPAQIRLVQKGGGAAHIDSVLLGGMPPSAVKSDSPLSLKKLSERDFDVIDAFAKTLELTFPTTGSDKTLRLKARVEPKRVSETPFQFPSRNLFKEINESAKFYTYGLKSGKPNNLADIKSADAEKPFFKEYCRTGSGHPSGFTYGWVRNDEKNLYIRVDFTPDNTMDGDKDYAKLYVKTDSGLKGFKISELHTQWGKPDFTYTDTVSYQHKVYNFKIPLNEVVENPVDEGKELLLAFSVYGTATPGQREPAVIGGYTRTVMLKSDGTVWEWGGSAGTDPPVQESTGANDWVAIAATRHTVALKSNGTVYAWRNNSYGQLGDGCEVGVDCTNSSTPVQVVNSGGSAGHLTEVVSIAAGELHTVALKSNGTVYAWGYNDSGQLGDGCILPPSPDADCTDSSTPVQVEDLSTPPPTGTGFLTDVVAIAAGKKHTVALKSDGTVWSWGNNLTGQLADSCNIGVDCQNSSYPVQEYSVATDWVAIAAQGSWTVALKSNGTVWTWGYNFHGQLGNNNTTNSSIPVQVVDPIDPTAAVLTGVVAIAAGGWHTVALKSNGTVYAWGLNDFGRLGNGTTTNSSIPVQVLDPQPDDPPEEPSVLTDVVSIGAGEHHTVALKSNGTVYAWGDNRSGQLGDGTTEEKHYPVHSTNLGLAWNGIAAGAYHSLALKSDGTLWAWGFNNDGQLGNGTTTDRHAPEQEVTGVIDWVAIAGGGWHTVALKSGGTLWAWGFNNDGQLGDGCIPDADCTRNSSTPVQESTGATDWVEIAVGRLHNAALKSDGTLWVWGSNSSGQLGDGCIPWPTPGYDCTDSSTPLQVEDPTAPPGSGSPLTDVVSIAAGDLHTVALKSSGILWAWGQNNYGQLGNGCTFGVDCTYSTTPVQVVGPSGSGYLTDVVSIASGGTVFGGHTLALKSDGTLWAWGWNNAGQLGNGCIFPPSPIDECTDSSTPVQESTGATDWVAIAAGRSYSLALKSDGTLWAWGSNQFGQLGDPNVDTRSSVPVRIGSDTDWTAIDAGYAHTLALKSDGTLWAWGRNDRGQLGDGTTTTRWSPTAVILSSFKAYEAGGQVVVEWETASETGTVGFYLLRLDEEREKYLKVNNKLLPGLLHSPQGGIYRYVDEGAQPEGTYTYQLVEVEVKGKKRTYGPFTITVGDEGIFGSGSEETLVQSSMESLSSGYSKKPHKKSSAKKLGIQSTASASVAAMALVVSDTVRIEVNQSGLYYVDGSEIAAVLGQSVKTVTGLIKQKALILENQGQMVAWLAAAGNAGIYFYGEAIESIYTNGNVYTITQGKAGKALTMQVVKGKGPYPGSGNETFTETIHVEEDHWPATALFDDPQADYWLWDYIISGDPDFGSKGFTLAASGVAGAGTANLTVHLLGLTDTDIAPDHHVEVFLNGTSIGEGYWDGASAYDLVCTFDPGLLYEGDNTIEVTGLLDTGAPYSIFYVDSFDLTYERYYQAIGNRVLVRGDGNNVITIEGFSTGNIFVFELGDSKKPEIIVASTLDNGAPDGSYRVSFTPAAPDEPYLALTLGAASTPVSVTPDTASKLKQRKNQADYLVIAPFELKQTAEELAVYRQDRGLDTMVVDLQDIYDEFSYGLSSPEAIRDFLSYAYHNWKKAPRYVVLAGEGTYDYKDNQGYGDNLLPVLMVATPHGLFASDNRFVDVVGNDGVPEMAIGRLPVATSSELKALIAKIIAYESESNVGSWRDHVLMVADGPDHGGDFPTDSDVVATLLPPQYTAEKIYLSEHNITDARQLVQDGINNGALLLNYIGHAGLDRFAQEGMLLSSDVGSLTNGYELPVVTAMTCVAGRFAIPGYDALGELLVLRQGGGAIAAWAPTGLSENDLAVILDESFFSTVFVDGENILGEVVLKALVDYAGAGKPVYMLDIFNLLGDPALEMR